jgi:hypothetical protein
LPYFILDDSIQSRKRGDAGRCRPRDSAAARSMRGSSKIAAQKIE